MRLSNKLIYTVTNSVTGKQHNELLSAVPCRSNYEFQVAREKRQKTSRKGDRWLEVITWID